MEYKRFGDKLIQRKNEKEDWVEVPADNKFEAEVAIRVEEVRKAENIANRSGKLKIQITRGG